MRVNLSHLFCCCLFFQTLACFNGQAASQYIGAPYADDDGRLWILASIDNDVGTFVLDSPDDNVFCKGWYNSEIDSYYFSVDVSSLKPTQVHCTAEQYFFFFFYFATNTYFSI